MSYMEDVESQVDILRRKAASGGHIRILSLETSCDETAGAIVEDGREIISNVVFTQIDLHALYGGVVPEIASRAHVEKCDKIVAETVKQANMALEDVDALAVTYGPGLVGALLIGVSCMKGLAYSLKKPLIPVNHIEGHVSANYITSPELKPPFICLVVSGGHSHIVMVEDYGEYRLIGQTTDDAAGEAFDKAARVLGLPYPGGPRIDKLAEEGNPHAFVLPHPHTEGRFDFSFSGKKTAFLNLANKMQQQGIPLPKADMAASFRFSVVEELVNKTMEAAKEYSAPAVAMAGGVSANSLLRREMKAAADKAGIPLYMPKVELCTDNGAMIASAAYYRLLKGEYADLTLNAVPNLRLL